MGYGCTSGTAQIGTANIARLVHEGCTTPKVTQPVSGLLAACDALNIKRLGFLSPYVEDVSAHLVNVLEANGVACPVFGSFDEACETVVAHISLQSTYDAAVTLAAKGGIDALFLSCTNLRTLDIIEQLEAETGLPVLSSNQVLAWHMAKLSGTDLTDVPFGTLFK